MTYGYPEPKAEDDATRSALAAYAHKAWSGWMTYMFALSVRNADGSVTIPESLVAHWKRKMNTAYLDLPAGEEVPDLAEADEIMGIVTDAAAQSVCPSCPLD